MEACVWCVMYQWECFLPILCAQRRRISVGNPPTLSRRRALLGDRYGPWLRCAVSGLGTSNLLPGSNADTDSPHSDAQVEMIAMRSTLGPFSDCGLPLRDVLLIVDAQGTRRQWHGVAGANAKAPFCSIRMTCLPHCLPDDRCVRQSPVTLP